MARRSVVLLAVLLVAALTVRVEAERGDIVPISGPVGMLNTPLTSFSSVVVDDVNQRVYVVSQQTNTIVAADFLGNQIAIRSGFAQLSNVVVGGGSVFALMADTGQVVRLDPATLAPTVLASGLVEPYGLAYADGNLYVFTKLNTTERVLQRINAITGATVPTSILTWFSDRIALYAFPQIPGYLFGVGSSGYRWNLQTGEVTRNSELFGLLGALPDGELLTRSSRSDQPNGLLARDQVTAKLAGRLWRTSPPVGGEPASWASSQRAMALSVYDLVELASIERPGVTYRSYTFPGADSAHSIHVAMSADSSRLFATMVSGGTVRLYAVPGVGISSAPSAPNPTGGSARAAAPQAEGALQSRSAAPKATTTPPWVMRRLTDIEFASDGSVFASDNLNGVVNRFAPDGTPIMGWRDLAGVESLAEFNGVMHGVLREEGSIVRFDPNAAAAGRVATGFPYASGLTAANGKLWTTYYHRSYASKAASVDPTTGLVWREPSEGSGFYWQGVDLAELPVAGHLLGYQTSGALRFDLNTLGYNWESLALSGPFAVAPDGLTVIEGSGRRLTASPFGFDGFVFPGSGHTISGANISGRRLVAALSSTPGLGLIVYDEANPADIVYSEPWPTSYHINRIEFRPGTTELWVGAVDGASGQASLVPVNVGPAPYVAAVVGADTKLDMGAVLPTRRLAAALASAEGLSSVYVQPGDPALGPTPPSTLVGPTSSGTVPVTTTLVDLTPAGALQPDPISPTSMPAATAASSTDPTSAASVSVSPPGSSTTVATAVVATTVSSGASALVAVMAAAPPGTKPLPPPTRVVPAKRRSAPTTTRRRVPAKRPASAPTPKRH